MSCKKLQTFSCFCLYVSSLSVWEQCSLTQQHLLGNDLVLNMFFVWSEPLAVKLFALRPTVLTTPEE